MHRAVEVEEGGISQSLPAAFRANQDYATLPKLGPERLVLRAHGIEAIEACFGGHPGRVLVGLMVHRAANDAGYLPKAIALTGASAEFVASCKAVIFERWALGLGFTRSSAKHFADVGQTDPSQPAGALPKQCAVTGGFNLAGCVAHLAKRTAGHVRRVNYRFHFDVACAIEGKGNFLTYEGRIFAAGERQDFAAQRDACCAKAESTSELA